MYRLAYRDRLRRRGGLACDVLFERPGGREQLRERCEERHLLALLGAPEDVARGAGRDVQHRLAGLDLSHDLSGLYRGAVRDTPGRNDRRLAVDVGRGDHDRLHCTTSLTACSICRSATSI